MINANELRIGNWFQQDASNNNAISRFFTVDEIKRYGVRSTYIRQDTNQPHTSLFSLDSIHPTPLTPEILEKCGFEKDNGGYCLSDKMSLSIHITVAEEYLPCWLDKPLFPGGTNKFRIIQHLHQLQNLYFALTGEELNYTP